MVRVLGMKKPCYFPSGVGSVRRADRLGHDEDLARSGIPQHAYAIFKILQKSGSRPRNAAQ
ncbi:hypothetical protein KFK09_018620 [Dendrobium nobile]|uniref:Uncharacterized protein n=1 Tax=Dendrobium nobile TaxID=94219 RepID=A0A8T3AWM1_DENNO|nr:hypothetical protein KFK09_018620 [Dendrobium nobile]